MFKRISGQIYPLLIILFFVCVALTGCDETRLDSDWPVRQIAVDAKYDDWGSAQAYYDEKEKVLVNLANDNDYLYICLVTRNRGLEIRLMESGFVAWFDPNSGKKKVFGIRFPVGLSKQGMSIEEEKRNSASEWYDQEDQAGVIDREKEKWQSDAFNKRLEIVEGLQDQLEIVNAGFEHKGKLPNPPLDKSGREREMDQVMDKKKPPHGGDLRGMPRVMSLEEAAKLGIQAKTGRQKDYFVYELKIPLTKSVEYPYAVGAKPGKTFGLGLEIAKFGMSKGKGPMQESGESGDGQGGPPEVMGQQGMMGSNEAFQLWAIVTLAKEP